MNWVEAVQEQDIQELKEKASKKKWDASVAAVLKKELNVN